VQDDSMHLHVLMLLKVMYALVNGPLLSQLAFMHYLIRTMGLPKVCMTTTYHTMLFSTVSRSKEVVRNRQCTGDMCCIIILHVGDLLAMTEHSVGRSRNALAN
jgi:hypothetical protein